jgi:oxygen-independent coproporphyrinogen-3 oxidase
MAGRTRRWEAKGMTPATLMAAIDDAHRRDDASWSGERPLAVYVHIPFCTAKCHFCDWVVDVPVSRLRTQESGRRDYVLALRQQISRYGPLLTRLGYRPVCMYWGGGTPTRLAEAEILSIAAALDDAFDLSGLRQWSMETTPYDVTAAKLEAARAAGVNRISIGLQSFNPDQLRRSGRRHTPGQNAGAVAMIRAAGFDTFNVDLICGFPGESRESLGDTLAQAIALDPPHISVYPYRATPKTVMAMQLERHIMEAFTPAVMIDAYELAMTMLGQAGYYEYCHGYWVRSPEHEDIDGNYKYDLSGDKIGFGSGAESIIGHHLLWNENGKYSEYLAHPDRFSFAHRFSLDEPQYLTAPVGGALMTREGIVFERFSRLTGLSFHDLRETAQLRRWLQMLADCGGRFVEDRVSLRLAPESIHRAYINHLAYTTGAGLAVARA